MAGDIISGVALGDSRLNNGRIISYLPGRTRLVTFEQYLIAFCSRPEAASGVISHKLLELSISAFFELDGVAFRPAPSCGGLLVPDNFRPYYVSDVISDVAVE